MVRLTVPIANLRFHRSADILNDGERMVSISDMIQEDFVSSIDDVVVAQILYIKKKKDETVFTRSRGTSEKNLSFDRLLMCRCLNSPSGLNCFAILLGVNKNARFFNRNLEGRCVIMFLPLFRVFFSFLTMLYYLSCFAFTEIPVFSALAV